jgi:uncharacterized protein YndB with AHSA1/START domain
MADPAFIHVVYIRAPLQAVWDALTDPDQTAKFWFGTAITSAWTPGAPVTYTRNGKVDVTGRVLEADPPRLLRYSFVHTDLYPAFKAEGESIVTYQLETEGEATRLTLIHDGFPVASGVRAGVSKGWAQILSGLKSLLETGRSLDLDPGR